MCANCALGAGRVSAEVDAEIAIYRDYGFQVGVAGPLDGR